LLKRAINWVGIFTLATVFVATPAGATAGILGTRSATLSDSAGNASGVTATFLVTPGTSATILGVKFSLCTSPLLSVTCASPGGATLASATAGSQLKNGGAITNAYGSPSYTSTTDVCFSNGTGNAFNGTSDTFTFPVQAIHLPTAVNTQFYFRMQTFTNTNCSTGPTDFGGFAESTTQTLAVSANVQESLVFCTGTNTPADCTGMTGSTVKIGNNPGTDNVLLLGTATGGISTMYITTNAASGYSITYQAAEFSKDGGTTNIAKANNQTIAACASGSTNGDCFGINIKANTTPAVGTNVTGASGFVAPTVQTGYGTADSFKFVANAAQQVASTTQPTVQTQYTVTYAAVAGTTTKPGAYTNTFTWIATGTF
jgi:hypothetical protein